MPLVYRCEDAGLRRARSLNTACSQQQLIAVQAELVVELRTDVELLEVEHGQQVVEDLVVVGDGAGFVGCLGRLAVLYPLEEPERIEARLFVRRLRPSSAVLIRYQFIRPSAALGPVATNRPRARLDPSTFRSLLGSCPPRHLVPFVCFQLGHQRHQVHVAVGALEGARQPRVRLQIAAGI